MRCSWLRPILVLVMVAAGALVAAAATPPLQPGTISHAILIEAEQITRANLEAVIDSGWTTREKVCQGVPAGIVPACG